MTYEELMEEAHRQLHLLHPIRPTATAPRCPCGRTALEDFTHECHHRCRYCLAYAKNRYRLSQQPRNIWLERKKKQEQMKS